MQRPAEINHKKIYFGHQSVGANILAGVAEVLESSSGAVPKVKEVHSPADVCRPGIFHSRIGENTRPYSKMNAFADMVHGGLGQSCDIAFFKFCYVDIHAQTDIQALFNAYVSVMSALEEQYPDLKLAHVTVPLRTVQSGIKVPIKKIIGRPVGGYADNIRRNEFNDLMRNAYETKGFLFDLAATEAGLAGGGHCRFAANGRRYEALAPQYTDDGGHLNKEGRRWVTEHLLSFLSLL